MLDIGCGDGFFSKRFLAQAGANVDALDIDPKALTAARNFNSDATVRFFLMDAWKEPFPGKVYEVVVWDGALAHFPKKATHTMLLKIKQALAPGGIFIGSESLGREDHGHLQFFEGLEDLENYLRNFFPYTMMRKWSYPINGGEGMRTEAFWRCSPTPEGICRGGWHHKSGERA